MNTPVSRLGLLLLAAAASGCSKHRNQFALRCSLTGPLTGKDSDYVFLVDEPKQRLLWNAISGAEPVSVNKWSADRIEGDLSNGVRSLSLTYDRAKKSMQLADPSGGAPNVGDCSETGLTSEESTALSSAAQG